MTNGLIRSFCLFLLFFLPQFSAAQSRPLLGVVWKQPDDLASAVRDLTRMHSIGVEAVRTELIRDSRLLTHADTLGIVFFQELPIAYLPAGALVRKIDEARQLLDSILESARNHPSVQYIGLAHLVDTSDPAACTYFEQVSSYVRQQAGEDLSLYYSTLFTSYDQCGQTVDFVLVDFLDLQPVERIRQRWRMTVDSLDARAVGVSAIGTWTTGDSLRGLRIPHSWESQARYLETALNWLIYEQKQDRPLAIFVFRWRDDIVAFPSPAHDPDDPYRRPYGLYRTDAQLRAAFDVVKGIYTGTQNVFAFPLGKRPKPEFPWIIVIGWAVLVMLGAFYALSPRLRQMVPRYFNARGFYRDAVREGRDMLLGSSSILLVALACSVGVVAAVILETIRENRAFIMLFRWIPRTVAEYIVSLLDQPWMIILLVGSLYALSLVFWSTILSVISRRRYLLSPGQVMMLVIWPRWPLILLLVTAMVVPSLPHEFALKLSLLLAAAWIIITAISILRTLYDFRSVARTTLLLTLLTALGNPVSLLLVSIAVIAILYTPEIEFLWHLITRA